MKNTAMQYRLEEEILEFITSRKSLQLATITEDGLPFSSYAPFAFGEECLFILLSDIAVHAENLKHNPRASVLIIEDEDKAGHLFARVRVNYQMQAEHIAVNSEQWQEGVDALVQRHGQTSQNLSELSDFNLFKLVPEKGRYVKGFGKAYSLEGRSLTGEAMGHMRDGHKKREAV